MKTIEIVALIQGLNAIQSSERELPRKLNYALDINRRRLLPLVEAYDEQVRQIVEKYAMRDDKNEMVVAEMQGSIKIDPSRSRDYVEEMRQLHETEVECDLHRIDIDVIPESFPAKLYSGVSQLIREPSNEPVPLRAVQQGEA